MSKPAVLVPAFAVAAFALAARADYTDQVVKIGVLNDQSRPYADPTGQGSVIAAESAVEDFGGKVQAPPIEMQCPYR